MEPVSNCPALIDNATVAGYYGQMTAVLAGFALTAMVILLTPPPPKTDEQTTAARATGIVLALFAAFVALILTTLTYSVLAGQKAPEASGRVATTELVDGLTFGLAVIMLFHGLALLMDVRNLQPAAVLTARAATVVLAPVLTMYYIAYGASDTELVRQMRATGSCESAPVPPLGVWLSVALLIVLGSTFLPWIRRHRWSQWARACHDWVPAAVLVLAVASAVVSGDLNTRSPGFLMSPTALSLYLVATFLVLASLGLVLSLGYPVEMPGRSTPDSDGKQRAADSR